MHARGIASLGIGLGCLCAGAHAQQVQFEFYERTGQTLVSPADSLLEIGVRARVMGGASLGGFGFNIISNDAEGNGTLAKARITVNGAYVPNSSAWAASASTGAGGVWGGVPSTYSYLAGISANFQGLINLSGGTFTNNPSINEIGLIAGVATGNALLGVPGMDDDGDNIPDTAPSNGAGSSQNNEIAPLNPSLAGPYFGNGQFVDVYHFRYTVTNFAPRQLVFTLEDLGAQVFNQLLYNNGAWGSANSVVPSGQIASSTLSIGTTPAPGCAVLFGSAAMLLGVRRRRS